MALGDGQDALQLSLVVHLPGQKIAATPQMKIRKSLAYRSVCARQQQGRRCSRQPRHAASIQPDRQYAHTAVYGHQQMRNMS
jgi:hypothetical protein